MSKAQHTPGPWESNNNGLVYGQVSGDGDEAPLICDVIDDEAHRVLGIMSPVEEANAMLIAAAPELLAALKAAVKIVQLVDDSDGGQLDLLSRVHAVIAKAEGK